MSEKRKIAAAIEYDDVKDISPRVTAKGEGLVADKIIALAREHNIPIRSDPGLVKMLSQLDIDDHIPVELYKAVAEILAFVYRANEEKE
ncbi:MAG: EscU/YscU/HrcU family type III secretion system export apparatus switch protein [Syntrophales bacterium]|nr:EscU/YscU/HrcU family type III secretion system export apparatus switch protein [Syntrophales bacterium]